MTLRFVEPNLVRLDEMTADLLVCAAFEDERPMRGLGGLLDWRLAGELSARLRERFTSGALGDALLVPGRPRLPFEKVVIVGLGPLRGFGDDVFRAGLAHMVRVAAGLQSRQSVVELPGRGVGAIDAARAAELTLEAARHAPQIESFWLVEPEAAWDAFTDASRPPFR